ncbi:molybdenum cofactor biosynthesis protein [Archaeoglobales archaeon]|nr:MAG: molybdenum cofactor biosynthesis protein [Archaeoglobales archaeon]
MEKHEAKINPTIGIITVSTSRWEEFGDVDDVSKIKELGDESGKIIKNLSNFEVIEYRLVPDDEQRIVAAFKELLGKVDVIITTGGTGIAPKDVTIEALEPLVDKKLDGFGEIFRMLSYKEVGTAAILSRAFAGVIDGKALFCLPGSKKAVKLAMGLINPLIRHVITHARGLK